MINHTITARLQSCGGDRVGEPTQANLKMGNIILWQGDVTEEMFISLWSRCPGDAAGLG